MSSVKYVMFSICLFVCLFVSKIMGELFNRFYKIRGKVAHGSRKNRWDYGGNRDYGQCYFLTFHLIAANYVTVRWWLFCCIVPLAQDCLAECRTKACQTKARPAKSPPGRVQSPPKGVRSLPREVTRPPSDEATKFHFILNNSRLYIAFIRFVIWHKCHAFNKLC